MRVCRVRLDETELFALYRDDHVIPIDQACEAYVEAMGLELLLPSTEDLLDFLPPDGPSRLACLELARWVEGLGDEELAELSVPIDEVQLLLRASTLLDDVGERGTVLLREAEQEVAAALHLLQPFGVELDTTLVIDELAGELLERIERRVVQLAESRERGIDPLERA